METLRNWGTEFLLATMKELRLATLNVLLPFVYTLKCSGQCIRGCVDWQSEWKNRKMGDLSDFERGRVVSARLAGESVRKTATLLGASIATVSTVMSAFTNHEKAKSAKRNSGRNSAFTKRDGRTPRWIVSETTQLLQHRWQQNWIFILKTVSTKTVQHELHTSNFHGRTATTKPLITESIAHTCKRWCHNYKTWTLDNRKRARDMVRWAVLHAVPCIRKRVRLENTQGSLQFAMLGSNSETWGRFCHGLGSSML
jgi:transposase